MPRRIDVPPAPPIAAGVNTVALQNSTSTPNPVAPQPPNGLNQSYASDGTAVNASSSGTTICSSQVRPIDATFSRRGFCVHILRSMQF